LTDIDQVIGDHPEADPALHAVVVAVSAAVETVAIRPSFRSCASIAGISGSESLGRCP